MAWHDETPTLDRPARRITTMLAYDTSQAPSTAIVLYGGTTLAGVADDTWRYDGASWLQEHPVHSPGPVSQGCMVFDGNHVLLFGGFGADTVTPSANLWSWDGTDWTQITTLHSPPALYGQGCAFDSATSELVVFGGRTADSNFSNETWLFDGSDWKQGEPPPSSATPPPARDLFQLAYDSNRKRVVMFGGSGASSPLLSDLWEWDGSQWNEVVPAGAQPAARYLHSLAYDSNLEQVLLFGGTLDNNTPSDETWLWDGATWTQQAPTNLPAPRAGAAATSWGINGLFIFGGSDGAALLGEGWSWVVSSWSENIGPDVPNGVYGAALAYDSALSKVIYFGSNSTTELWTWDGLHWRDVSAPGMLPRSYAAVSFDDARSRLVVFGGYDGRNELGDTIEWDGAQWITMTPDHSPTARHGASMVYDPVRAVTVLFGGSDTQGNYSDDTWQWDGTDWVPEAATSGSPWPNARWFASMAYDATLGVVVMWSGGSTVEFHDTWQWDGSTWTQTSSSAPGVVSSQFNLAYNTHLGLDIGVVDGATYSWNGAAWTQLVANPGPPQVQSYAVAYDASRFRLIEIGGGNNDNAPTVWSVTDPFLPAPGGP